MEILHALLLFLIHPFILVPFKFIFNFNENSLHLIQVRSLCRSHSLVFVVRVKISTRRVVSSCRIIFHYLLRNLPSRVGVRIVKLLHNFLQVVFRWHQEFIVDFFTVLLISFIIRSLLFFQIRACLHAFDKANAEPSV